MLDVGRDTVFEPSGQERHRVHIIAQSTGVLCSVIAYRHPVFLAYQSPVFLFFLTQDSLFVLIPHRPDTLYDLYLHTLSILRRGPLDSRTYYCPCPTTLLLCWLFSISFWIG